MFRYIGWGTTFAKTLSLSELESKTEYQITYFITHKTPFKQIFQDVYD